MPNSETVTTLTPEEIEKFKAEAFSTFKGGKQKYQQTVVLNMGLRTGELLGPLNSDTNLERKTLMVRQGVKEVLRRDSVEFIGVLEIKVGKPKSTASKRTVILNRIAIGMVENLCRETYFCENSPLV